LARRLGSLGRSLGLREEAASAAPCEPATPAPGGRGRGRPRRTRSWSWAFRVQGVAKITWRARGAGAGRGRNVSAGGASGDFPVGLGGGDVELNGLDDVRDVIGGVLESIEGSRQRRVYRAVGVAKTSFHNELVAFEVV